jgi:hypothetical protein
MDVSTFFVSYAQATKLIQPREGPFHNPPPSRPKPLPCFVLRMASKDKMWRARNPRRSFSAS